MPTLPLWQEPAETRNAVHKGGEKACFHVSYHHKKRWKKKGHIYRKGWRGNKGNGFKIKDTLEEVSDTNLKRLLSKKMINRLLSYAERHFDMEEKLGHLS